MDVRKYRNTNILRYFVKLLYQYLKTMYQFTFYFLELNITVNNDNVCSEIKGMTRCRWLFSPSLLQWIN